MAPAIVQIRSDRPLCGLKLASHREEGHLLHLAVEALPACALRQGEQVTDIDACPAGFLRFFDLRQPATLDISSGHHILQVRLRNAVLRDCAERQGWPVWRGLRCTPATSHHDPVVHHLGLAILAALACEDETGGLLPDLIVQAVAQHVVARYGDRMPGRSAKGMLAPWQERRAKDLMEANLATGITLGQLAEACRLSVTHFARAFRRSTGTSAHRWLQERRIERAMAMLASDPAPLAAIAQACGFADQSHFTKIFTGIAGTSPGQWRRRRRIPFDPDQAV